MSNSMITTPRGALLCAPDALAVSVQMTAAATAWPTSDAMAVMGAAFAAEVLAQRGFATGATEIAAYPMTAHVQSAHKPTVNKLVRTAHVVRPVPPPRGKSV